MSSIEQLETLKQQVIELQEKLNKLTWNQDKWEPKKGDWSVGPGGDVFKSDSTDDYRLFGMERETKELAEKAAIKMRQFNRLLAYHDEFCPDYEFIIGRENYYIYFNSNKGLWEFDFLYELKSITVFFSKDIAEELVDKLNSCEVEL